MCIEILTGDWFGFEIASSFDDFISGVGGTVDSVSASRSCVDGQFSGIVTSNFNRACSTSYLSQTE